MGIYVNKTSTGLALPFTGKAQALIADGASITHPEFQPNLICVVENPGSFDAAMYCPTEEQFLRTRNKQDLRKRTYLIHAKAAEIADKI